MKQIIFLYVNPNFDNRFKCGISKLYQIFSKQYGYNLEIIDQDFLRENIPEKDNPQTLVIVGGDGTIHKAINNVPDEVLNRYFLGIIPAGTANEFAKSLKLPISIEKAAKIISARKKIMQVKKGMINDKIYFVTDFLYGIACKILEETPEKIKFYLGQYAYQLPGLFSISNYNEFLKNFKINSTRFKTSYLLINNIGLMGKNLPHFSPGDLEKTNKNLFTLVYVHSHITAGDYIRLILKNQAGGNILDDSAVYYKQINEATIEFQNSLKFMLDGEPYTMNSPISIKHSEYEMNIIVEKQ